VEVVDSSHEGEQRAWLIQVLMRVGGVWRLSG